MRALAFLLLASCSSFTASDPQASQNDGGDPGSTDGGTTADSDPPPPPPPMAVETLSKLDDFPVTMAASGKNVAVFRAKGGRLFMGVGEQKGWYTTGDDITGPAFVVGGDVAFLTKQTARSCPMGSGCSQSGDFGVSSDQLYFAAGDTGVAFANATKVGACAPTGCGGGGRQLDLGTPGITAVGISTQFVFVGTTTHVTTVPRPTGDFTNLYDEDLGAITSIAVGSGNVVFATATDLYACPPVRNGCHPTHIAKTTTTPKEVVVRGTNVYWLEPDFSKVYRCPLVGCTTPIVVVDAVQGAIHFAIGERIFITTTDTLWRTTDTPP